MKPDRQIARSCQAGFSLVEILVGLLIGLLATLVIMQVFSVFEGQKRTTTGVSDAQTNGSIALFSLERELLMAGYGLLPLGAPGVPDSPIECTTLNPINTSTGFPAASGVAVISPAIIIDGGNTAGTNNSDSITIHYGGENMGGIPGVMTVTGNNLTIPTGLGCQANDIAVIYNGASCALESIAGVSGIPASIALAGAGTLPTQAVSGADLSCLGAWNEVTYSINNGNLYRTSNGGTPVPVIAGIVNIQAQYGISSAPNSNTIIQWVDASGSTWGTPSTTDRNRIKALRVAIVARNSLLEKDNVTDPCNSNTADASSLTGLCAWSATSLSPQNPSPAPWIYLSNDADGTSWQRYRYRVFETVIPLRNMIWSRSTL